MRYRSQERHITDNNAKVAATGFIWTATACVFIFGVFTMNWTGFLAGILWAVVSLAIAAAAGASTVKVWSPPTRGPE